MRRAFSGIDGLNRAKDPGGIPLKETGVLLVNTGTPDAPEETAIARYLDEFLMDPAIIGAPWPIRRMIVNRIVSTRPKESAKKYRAFWTEEGSPYLNTCLLQGKMLQGQLEQHGMQVAVAMRYGNPSIESALASLKGCGCTRLVVVPCYPQYARVCAGTCFTAVRKALARLGWNPVLVEIDDFYQQPCYRKALADSVGKNWTPAPGSKLVVSCHSTLLKDIEQGDPYRDQVEETAANLAEDLGICGETVVVSYQSRFDDRKWLQPSTKDTVVQLAEAGTSIAVICPVFVTDNIETAIEVDAELRSLYCEHAPEGCTFTYIPCLNDDPDLIRALADAVLQGL